MPRPKKLSSDIMLSLLQSFYDSQIMGDSRRLKYSLLEKYAAEQGYDVKAYDFKRDKKVRAKMEQLKQLSAEDHGARVLQGLSYKSIDAEGMINRCHNKAELVAVITEIDKNWKSVHDAAADIVKRAADTKAEASEQTEIIHCLTEDKEHLEEELQAAQSQNSALVKENRYLRKMIRTYLYPGIADQILIEEQAIAYADTNVTESAMTDLADPAVSKPPSSFSQSTSKDRRYQSGIRSILTAMMEGTE